MKAPQLQAEFRERIASVLLRRAPAPPPAWWKLALRGVWALIRARG